MSSGLSSVIALPWRETPQILCDAIYILSLPRRGNPVAEFYSARPQAIQVLIIAVLGRITARLVTNETDDPGSPGSSRACRGDPARSQPSAAKLRPSTLKGRAKCPS